MRKAGGGGRRPPSKFRRQPRPPSHRVGDRDPGVKRMPPQPAPAPPAVPVREIVLRVLFEVETRSAFADRQLDMALARLEPRREDRQLATQLVNGTLRWQRRLDHVADALLRVDRQGLPVWIRLCLRLGIYQLLFLDRVPRHAAVDETVRLAKKYGHPGTAGLVNAILRRLPEALGEVVWPDPEAEPVRFLAVTESHPDWLVERWVERYGVARAHSLLSANNAPSQVVVRVNRQRTSQSEVLRQLRRAGIEAEPGRMYDASLRLPPGADIFNHPLFTAGALSVQDESESMVMRLVNPQPGERLLDLCAGPGTKLAHMMEWTRAAPAWCVGVDANRARLLKARQGLERLGHPAAAWVCADGRQFGRGAAFDRVLVDAPCSGLAVLRRRADARWRKRPDSLVEMAKIQEALLDRAAELVRPLGCVVYSVCSFEPEECEGIVNAFLERHPDWCIDPPGAGLAAGRTAAGLFQILHDQDGHDGVTAVRLRRRSLPSGSGPGTERKGCT